jgi:hypothetical protein
MAINTVTLTTAHAASSYGRPVAVIDGEAYGPADVTPDGAPVGAVVRTLARDFLEPLGDAKRVAELEEVLRALWQGAMIGGDGAGFVRVSPGVTAAVVAAHALTTWPASQGDHESRTCRNLRSVQRANTGRGMVYPARAAVLLL